MPVYVDDMCLPADVPNGPRTVRGKWSHLYADSHDELMAMAEAIGLKPEWIQHEGEPGEHFDVVMSKRAQAIKTGAKEVTWREAGLALAERRKAMKQDAERPAEGKQPCPVAEPCGQERCGACYPDEVMRRDAEEREAQVQLRQGAALECDRAAAQAYKRGDYGRALTWLRSARELDPDMPGLAGHFQRAHQAEREAVAKVSEPRDMGQLADTFAERLGPQRQYEAQRDASRGEPAGKCDAPNGEARCGEPGHLYPAGRRCDEHRPKQIGYRDKEMAG